MTRPRTYQTPAIIIKKTRLGEADRILTLYTPEQGKIQGVAKAVRRPQSKLSGHLELLGYSQVTLARGKNIDTIIGSQTLNCFLAVRSDLDMLSCACYLIELVNQFTPDETADRQLFDLLLTTLESLALASCQPMLLRYFELHLLLLAGYKPELEKCVLCRKPLEDIPGGFSPSAGGVLCQDCQSRSHHYGYPTSSAALAALRLIQGSQWPALQPDVFGADTLAELESLLRRYIRYLLEKDIKSAFWLDCLKNPSFTQSRI
jgi:DNA repair protein RecO (recombination protein O)